MGKSSMPLFNPSKRVLVITLLMVLYLFASVMYVFSVRSGFATQISMLDSFCYGLFILPAKAFLAIANMLVLETGSLTRGDYFRFPLLRGLLGSLTVLTAVFYLIASLIDRLLAKNGK